MPITANTDHSLSHKLTNNQFPNDKKQMTINVKIKAENNPPQKHTYTTAADLCCLF